MCYVDTPAILYQVRSHIFAPFASIFIAFTRMLIDYWARIIDTLKTSISGAYLTNILVNIKSASKQ